MINKRQQNTIRKSLPIFRRAVIGFVIFLPVVALTNRDSDRVKPPTPSVKAQTKETAAKKTTAKKPDDHVKATGAKPKLPVR